MKNRILLAWVKSFGDVEELEVLVHVSRFLFLYSKSYFRI
jgi:hypothetical protein